ncbi:MAG: TlpA family protein disulfide reductase, partial [Pedobacter sp.]
MRKILLFAFAFLYINLHAKQKEFLINGNVLGPQVFTTVSAYDNEFQLITTSKIIDGKFSINGVYNQNQRFGELAIVTIVMLKTDNSVSSIRFSKKLDNQVTVILGEPIELTYNSSNKRFTMSSGELNNIQQKFQDVFLEYRCERDSLFGEIEKLDIKDGAKIDQKIISEKSLFSKAINKTIPIVLEYSKSQVSLFNFSPIIYEETIPGKIVKEIFDRFSAELKDSEYGQHVLKDVDDKISQEEILGNPSFIVGMVMPFFELPDSNKNLIKSTSSYGKYTLIDFWASWCTPCRNETPNLIKAYTTFNKSGFKIITVSLDEIKD